MYKRSKSHRLAESVPIGLAITERDRSLFMFSRVAERSVGAAGTAAARHSKVKANARVNNMVREGGETTSVWGYFHLNRQLLYTTRMV